MFIFTIMLPTYYFFSLNKHQNDVKMLYIGTPILLVFILHTDNFIIILCY